MTARPKGARYLARQGTVGAESGGLSEEGMQSARNAADFLSERVGRTALIVSADSPPAIQTAETIRGKIGADLLLSRAVTLGGDRPAAIQDLEGFLKTVITLGEHQYNPAQDLVVVSPDELIWAGVSLSDYEAADHDARGGVYIAAEEWDNPHYDLQIALSTFGVGWPGSAPLEPPL